MTRNPTRIGRYDLITALATGGMGRIYLGRATGIGGFERKVVIKTLEVPVTAESDPAIAMFLDEARLLGLLHHQHIASVFEVGRDEDDRHYMVVDYLDGHSAHDVWERAFQLGAALPLDFTLTVASATANGLHYAHTRRDIDGTPLGIVHRDVTPSNVMIGYDGAVQLIDFGIAMAAHRKTKTQTGFVKGKVGYLSPEQVAGRDVDPRTDVFALGILLYELSTLHRAFRDSSDLATMQRIKAGRFTRPSLLVPDYPPGLETIVMKALQVDPRERFADADALRRAIEALGHRLHLVLGDAAIIEVMTQLFEDRTAAAAQQAAERASEPSFDWVDSDHDLTVRRDPDELLAVLRAENALAPSHARDTARDAVDTPPALPAVRSRKLRAATEVADALIDLGTEPPILPLLSPVETPSGITQPGTQPALSPAPPPPSPPPIPARRPAKRATARPMSSNTVIGASLVQARSGRRARLRWIGFFALLAVAASVAYYATRDPSNAVAGATSPPAAEALARHPAQPAAPAAPAAPSPPDPPPAPSKIHIRLTTRPGDATVLLDNKKLGHTPLDETVAADPGKHVLKLRHRGYATYRLDVTLDADITQDIALAPQR